jgi:hypothetical protein
VLALRLAGKRELAQLDSSDLEVTGITPLHGLGVGCGNSDVVAELPVRSIVTR